MVHHTKKHRKRNTRKRQVNRKRRETHKRSVTHKRRVTRKRRMTHKRRVRSKKVRRAGACCVSRPKSDTRPTVRKARQSTSTTSTKSAEIGVYNSLDPSEDALRKIYEDVKPIPYLNSKIELDDFMKKLQDNPSKPRIKLYGGEKYKFENLDIHRDYKGTYYMYISDGEVANGDRKQVKLIHAIKYLIAPDCPY
jgi:hypothetical protein